MPFYVKVGKVPPKRHTTFYKDDGKSLHREELFSTRGFSGIYSNKYHLYTPTQVEKIDEIKHRKLNEWSNALLQYYHFFTDNKKSDGNFITSRNEFLKNDNCIISTAHPTEDTDIFFRNSYAHELLFIHKGSGEFLSEYGLLPFKEWDYIIVPKGTTYQLKFKNYKKTKLFIVESSTPFDIPKHFRNEYGQLTEDAPYYERDFIVPEFMDPIDKKGKFELVLKVRNRFFKYFVPHHPFDVVGWDGFLYPYTFNIKEYAPKVGKIHLPPPAHLLFTTQHFVVCNFVPRLYDFHPDSIPAPYYHSNVDSDEVLYYVDGNFMSRKGIKKGSITLHPMGIPHGPQPGKTEASIGKKETNEYAIMIDTFQPLQVTKNVKETMTESYSQSWLEKK
ncbi:MAG: homogentisate 1,2-dioxygenase [Ignavibacteria bacterium]|nr:homogentisate 1,2-dioxygenase [Ignavibacteria bacterium]MBT8383236.1 homogentisate 1,2-dioxygenase [Ignavibacteria bacterium]NNL21311.1 homogentisate 1,2-dioxygenase [Ignavibacteriaceae bacterium]